MHNSILSIKPVFVAVIFVFFALSANVAAAQTDLPDGDFEQMGANNPHWIEYRDYGNRPIVVTNAPTSTVTPRSGNHFAWLGGAHNLDPSTQNNQSRIIYGFYIPLPNESPVQLHFWYWLDSQQAPDYDPLDPGSFICVDDVVNIWINNYLLEQGQICDAYNTNGWVPITLDITAWAGQQISLEFEMRTNYEGISHFFIDDVDITTGSTPTAVGLVGGSADSASTLSLLLPLLLLITLTFNATLRFRKNDCHSER